MVQSISEVPTSASLPSDLNPAVIWQALAQASGAAVTLLDPDGVIEFANPRSVELIGSASGEVVGKRLHDLFSQPFADAYVQALRAVAASGQNTTVVKFIRGHLLRSTLLPLPDHRVLVICADPGEIEGAVDLALGATGSSREDELGPLAALSARELEVLAHIGAGKRTSEIASALSRSAKTIEHHIASIARKMGVSNRVELARIAVNAGLVDFHNHAAA
jgi:DNA-binding CsgD family transcriptional regulator